jgi:hypothetical protein
MARVNITMPDELARQARAAGLNVSELARGAVAAELDRRQKIALLDEYLADLRAELGPPSDAEIAAAEGWGDELFGPSDESRSA